MEGPQPLSGAVHHEPWLADVVEQKPILRSVESSLFHFYRFIVMNISILIFNNLIFYQNNKI
jgi:hypothetical protein